MSTRSGMSRRSAVSMDRNSMNWIKPAALALLAAVVAWSCGEPASNPTGPEVVGLRAARGGNGKGAGGSGGGSATTLALSGGMTAEAQTVTIVSDNKRKLELNTGGAASYVVATNFASTAEANECTISPADADPAPLKAKLVDAFPDGRYLTLKVDRTSLGSTSSGHLLAVTWQPAGGQFTLAVQNAVVTSDAAGATFSFQGGQVMVEDRSGRPKDNVTLRCTNHDTVDAATTGL